MSTAQAPRKTTAMSQDQHVTIAVTVLWPKIQAIVNNKVVA